MHCIFNPDNKSDNPLIICFIGPDGRKKYVMTSIPTMSIEVTKEVIRGMHLLHSHHIIVHNGVTYESYNMARKDLVKFAKTQELPAGTNLIDESPYMNDIFKIYERRSKEQERA